jgi:hypothetical protein
MGAQDAFMEALTLSSTDISDLTMMRDGSMLSGEALSCTEGPRGVGRWNVTSNDAVRSGTGFPVGSFQPR